MAGSFQIAKIFGIPVLLHWSLGFIALLILYLGFGKSMNFNELLWVTLAMMALFLSILLHEFGHALTARRYGVQTKDIVLLPIGGLARLSKLPEKPIHEFIVAIAGPLVNFAIAILLLPYLYFVMAPGIEGREAPTPNDIAGDYFYFIPFVFAMNIGLGVFNLLPAFPMDGGRILRALLASWLGKLTATRIAMIVGQLIAVGMVVLGFMGYNYFYILIGLFIFFSALREFRWVKLDHDLSRHRVWEVIRRNFSILYVSDPLHTAFDLLSRGPEHHFLVFDNQEQLSGTISGEVITQIAESNGLSGEVGDYYRPGIAALTLDNSLKQVDEVMRTSQSEILPVVENEVLVGVVDREAVENFLKFKDRSASKTIRPA